MNNHELDQLLRSVTVPERPPEFWERLTQRVTAKLHWQPRINADFRRPAGRGLIWNWGVAVAAVLLCLGFLLGNWHGRKQTTALLQNEKLLREVLATFPNQVRAIVQDENGLHLSLADQPDVAQTQPLWIRVCEGKSCRSILTFSGQVLQIGGRTVEALADAEGGVLLVGENFVWSSREGSGGDAAQIRAEQLPCAM